MVATGVPLASAGGRFLFAWMGDRIERKKVLAITLVMMLVGLVCFELVDILGTVVLVLYLVLFGVGYGGGIGLRPGLVREYFGRANFGTVFGLMMGMGALGTVAGPLIAGWIYDTWGSYQNAWFVFTVFAAVAVFLVFLLPSDKKRTK